MPALLHRPGPPDSVCVTACLRSDWRTHDLAEHGSSMSLRLKIMLGAAALLAAAAVWRWVTYEGSVDPGMGADEAHILELERDGDLKGLNEVVTGSSKVKVVRMALAAMGRIGGDKAAEYLAAAMTASRPEVRAAAAANYPRVRMQSTAAPLARLAREDEVASVRATAVEAIGRMYAYDEMDTLLGAMADDKELSVRRNAQDAVVRIFHRHHTYTATAERPTRRAQVAYIRAEWIKDKHAIKTFHTMKHHSD